MPIEYTKGYSLTIQATELGWFSRTDVVSWLVHGEVATWPGVRGHNFFTTWDHGEGCDCPASLLPSPRTMPQWLWNELATIVNAAGLADEYVIIHVVAN